MKIPSRALKSLFLVASLSISQALFADGTNAESTPLKVAAIFGDNMVLQQEQPVPVWGWSAPGAEVTVKFSGRSKSTQADKA